MDVKDILVKELVKNGHAKFDNRRIWNISNRSFLHLTPDLSKGFLSLVNSKPYQEGIFKNEIKLIKNTRDKFLSKIGTNKPFNLIDIGCGDGTKALEFLKGIKGNIKVRYCPISPDKYLTDVAISNMKKQNIKNVTYKPYISRFEDLGEIAPVMRSSTYPKNVFLLHGSILASYEINDFLFNISRRMLPGDFIIIGNGIRKGDRFVGIDKYKHKAFDDWFIHLLTELGFQKTDVEYNADFRNARMESFYKLKKDNNISRKGKTLNFKKGDEIIVFKLYKYYLQELEKFLKMYFLDVEIAKDPKDEYVLALCKK